jgi:hypothetical protein
LTRPKPYNSFRLVLTLQRATERDVGDLLGAQRAPRVQQGVDLRYGGAYAPSRSQFAPVQDDFSVTAERFMSKTPMNVILRSVTSVIGGKADLTIAGAGVRV